MDKYCKAVLRHRWLVIVASIVLIALSALGGRQLQFNPDIRALYDSEHPVMRAMLEVEDEFTKRDIVMIVLAPEQGDVFEPRFVELLQSLSEQAWRIPYASRVDSITNFQHTEALGDDLIVGDLLPAGESSNTMLLERLRLVALSEPALLRTLVSEQSKVAAVNISFQARTHTELVEQLESIMGEVNTLVAEHQAKYPNVRFLLSGNHAVNYSLRNYTRHDSQVLIPLMLLTMVGLLLILLRSWYATFCSAVIVLATGASTMGIFGWLGLHTDVVSAIAPIVIMTLAVADAVHLVNGASQGKDLGKSDTDSIVFALNLNMKPIFLTSLTTALGVLTFSFTDFPPLVKLATIIAVGVTVAFALSVTMLPAMLSLRPIKRRKNARLGPVLNSVFELSTRHYRTVVALSIPVLLLTAWLIPQNVLDESPKVFFEETTDERKIIAFVEEHLAGVSPVDIAIYGAEEDAVYANDFLHTIDEFSSWLRQQDNVRHVTSIADTLKRLNKSMHGDSAEHYRLPNDRELAAQYILLYELSLPAGLELTHQLNIDKSATLVSVTKASATAATAVSLKSDILEWFNVNAPELRVVVTGLSQSASELAYTYLIPSMLEGGVAAIIAVSLVLFVALSSLRLGVLGMLATCFPIAVGYGAWALYSGVMGFAIASVAGICLGVVVDFVIHFLSKYRLAKVEGKTTIDAIRFAFETVARAIWVTMLVLVAGFWVLTLSEIGLNSDLGLLTGFVILLAALFNLLVLPAYLMMFDGKKSDVNQ
ncbi:MAG: RND family transporter [Pseudomonadales bacterium]